MWGVTLKELSHTCLRGTLTFFSFNVVTLFRMFFIRRSRFTGNFHYSKTICCGASASYRQDFGSAPEMKPVCYGVKFSSFFHPDSPNPVVQREKDKDMLWPPRDTWNMFNSLTHLNTLKLARAVSLIYYAYYEFNSISVSGIKLLMVCKKITFLVFSWKVIKDNTLLFSMANTCTYLNHKHIKKKFLIIKKSHWFTDSLNKRKLNLGHG